MWSEMKENEGLDGLRRHAMLCNFSGQARARAQAPPEIVLIARTTRKSTLNAFASGIHFSYDSSTIPMRFFRELDLFASHLAVVALAIATWVFLIVRLWRRWRLC